MHRRSLRLGLPTLFGLARKGFFIPYRYADTLPRPGTAAAYTAVEARMAAAEPRFLALMDGIDALADDLQAIQGDAPPEPRWNQGWFAPLDAAAAYAVVRRERPARIVEIGSGHSTRFLKRAVTDGGLATRITAIDPMPRRGVDRLDIALIAKTLAAAGPEPFAELAAGDVLFIDSSHILMPGSDVDDILNRILPALPAGVLVHVHDVFLPDDYPRDWGWRGYNEQSGIAPLITTAAYELMFASHYTATRLAARLAASIVAGLPAAPDARPASLWLRKA